MSITQIAIDKNRVTAVAIVVVLVFGVMTYIDMPRAEDPGISM